MGRTSIIVTAVFAGMLLLLEGMLAFYWDALLEPRLRSDAEAHAKLLAQSHEAELVAALAAGSGEARRRAVVDAMDRILLTKEPVGGTPFVTSLRLELDYDLVDEPLGSLDIERGERGRDAFRVDVPLYDPDTFELLGIAWLDVTPAFFDRLSNDVRRQLVLQGLAILLILLAVWAALIATLGKLERINDARRRAEMQLRVHEKKFGRLLDDLGTYFVYSRDRSGRLTEVSDSVEQVLGVSPESYVSGFREQLSADPINVAAVRRLTSPPEECGAGRAEIEIRDASGGLHRVELTEVLVTDERGGVAGIDGIAHDVTEQRAFELALRDARALAEDANLAKSQFLANVSHEIRTPMNAILGMTILALRTDLDSRQRNYLDKIHASGRLLLRIINDILDLSRIDAGKLTIQRVDFRLDDVLNDLSGVVGGKAREKGLEVLFAVSPDVPRSLRGDPARLEQVLVNLVNNAVKFTSEGEILVTVSLETVEGERKRIRFEVRDTGPGIPEGEIERLFDPFTQVDESASRQHGGVGLGLAISKRLVELMGGEITCESEIGVGSVFWFTVTVEAAEQVARRSLRRRDLEGLSVLVVDDNPTARQVFTEMLRSLGFDATSSAHAELAIEELKRRQRQGNPISLVLMDWKMPGLDGIEAAVRIKAGLEGALQAVPPVVLVTAYGGSDIIKRAEMAGVDAFVNKPVSRSAMWNAVLEALGRPVDADAERQPALLDSIRFGEGLRILVVEDNEINREVARELLGAAGLQVEEAATGPEALEAISKRRPDLVLMDVHMPGMDGLEVTRRIRQASDGNELPVIALTAHAMLGDRQRFLDAGMDDYVAKPIEEDQLFEVLARWLPHERVSGADDPETQRDLPAIPGVDVPRAVKRLRGDVRLLQRLVGDLARRYSGAEWDIGTLLESGRTDEAANLAHTLRGSAGSLVATRVADAAGAIESAIRSGADARPLLPSLGDGLLELAAGQGDAPASEVEGPGPASHDEGSKKLAAEALDRLLDHLASNSLGAVEALEQLRQLLDGREGAVVRSLEEYVDSLRFEDARGVAEDLARSLGLPDDGGAA
jgi:PAS domain S-box-containing protein